VDKGSFLLNYGGIICDRDFVKSFPQARKSHVRVASEMSRLVFDGFYFSKCFGTKKKSFWQQEMRKPIENRTKLLPNLCEVNRYREEIMDLLCARDFPLIQEYNETFFSLEVHHANMIGNACSCSEEIKKDSIMNLIYHSSPGYFANCANRTLMKNVELKVNNSKEDHLVMNHFLASKRVSPNTELISTYNNNESRNFFLKLDGSSSEVSSETSDQSFESSVQDYQFRNPATSGVTNISGDRDINIDHLLQSQHHLRLSSEFSAILRASEYESKIVYCEESIEIQPAAIDIFDEFNISQPPVIDFGAQDLEIPSSCLRLSSEFSVIETPIDSSQMEISLESVIETNSSLNDYDFEVGSFADNEQSSIANDREITSNAMGSTSSVNCTQEESVSTVKPKISLEDVKVLKEITFLTTTKMRLESKCPKFLTNFVNLYRIKFFEILLSNI
jgi:hypothetical protein